VTIVPFKAEHLHVLRLQAAQAALGFDLLEYARQLELAGGGWTALVDGAPVACAGLVEQWHGRALAWALIGDAAGRHFVSITRAVKRALNLAHYRRVEAQVDAEFSAGIRWAQLLGFEVESIMRKFTPEGRDAFMYVRIR
jgi:RimJ/RimL family protein N-acetyltransferase